jgi:alpha-aminoadipate carrier protein LysW
MTFPAPVYNTPVAPLARLNPRREQLHEEEAAVIRCPDCAAELDVDEDEVEEGEILNCPECETELEVTQTHPVQVNPISDELDDDEEEEEEDPETGGDGDLPKEDKEDEEEEEDEA